MGAEASRKWRQRNPEKVRAMKRASYQRNKVVIRARRAPRNLERARQLRTDVLAALGNACVRCGFADERALQVDHVHGGGTQERRVLKSTSMRYNAVLANPSRYQLLCANCNWIKRAEEQEYGPKSRRAA